MKTASALLGLCLYAILVSTSLSASPESMLIGKWKYFEGEQIEFVKDGTLILGNQGAKYRVIDRERIEFEMGIAGILSHYGPRPVFRFGISNDELTLIPISEPNKPQKLRRVKVDASGNDAHMYINMGINNAKQGNYQQAIKDYDKAIELDPKYAQIYLNRAAVYGKLGNYTQVIKDSTKVIELDPKSAVAYFFRGNSHIHLGNYQQAMKDYDKAIELNPEDAFFYNNLAWFLATAKAPSFRNGKKAVELALKACELSGRENPNYLDTLAAAYARVGDFDNAVKWQEKALESPEYPNKPEAQQRLNFYREGKAWPD